MAAMTVSKEDVRSSKINFDAFMEDMEMVVTYVAGDETGAMSRPTTITGPPSPVFSPELGYSTSTQPSNSKNLKEDKSGAQAFHLGAAAIVSSRRAPATSYLLVDMDEIQSTLNASFPEELCATPPILGPIPTVAAPVPVVAPKPVTAQAQPEASRVTTRTSRAAGHSDAPRPIGYPVPNGIRSPIASASDPSISLVKSNPGASTKVPAVLTPETASTSSSRPNSPTIGSDGLSDSGNSNGRSRVRNQTPTPIPVGRTQGFATFEEFLLEPNGALLKALCTCLQVTEATKTCASIVMVYESKQRTLDMVKAMIEFEVSLQKTAATLFRNNSLTTHMMTCYTKLVGLPFLKTVVGPVIMDAFNEIDAGNATYEIDPSKMAPGEDIKQNISDLRKLVHSFFDRILNSRAVMPKNFMEICNSLQTSTVDRFPESRFFVIGGFLFLRYICPAVVAPDGYKLITATITDKQRRMLVLVSKILQTIANERTFGEKEEYMMCMNPLVNEYQSIVQYFFNQLAKPVMPDTPENVPAIVINKDDYQLALQQILTQAKSAKAKLLAHSLIAADPKLLSTVENLDNIAVM